MTDVLKIWGRASSINVKKVVWTAQELGLEFQRTEAGGQYGLVKTPEYMALNPNSLVPAIQDGDFVLWESNTIVRYLLAKHSAGQIYPADLQQRFDAERWMDWQQTSFNPASRPAFWQLIRTPPEQRDLAAIAASSAAVEVLLATLDAHLANRSYMVGERFTMADIPLACEAHRWFALPQARQSHANVERWFDRLRARQASKGVLDMVLS
jgi:glutathione S-transferase